MIRQLLMAAGLTAVGPDTWDLTVITTDVNQDYTVDIETGSGIDIDIDWGDSTLDTYTTTGEKTHVYASAGTYTVKISGSFSSNGNIRLGSNAGNCARLTGTGIVCELPGLVSFNSTFYNCTGLTGSIPADLFRYNTAVSISGFSSTFRNCTGLTGSIPADLFRYNTAVSTSGFYRAFRNCTGLTGSIPADLFRYNTAVSTSGFREVFFGCTGLTGSIPAWLFRYNTAVSTYGFIEVFYNCLKLELSPYIFFAAGEESTRFLNKASDFTQCFYLSSTYSGAQGTAPALWDCDFGTETQVTTDCFQGHSSSTVSNWADIPAGWT